jgi:hypothetical protein
VKFLEDEGVVHLGLAGPNPLGPLFTCVIELNS